MARWTCEEVFRETWCCNPRSGKNTGLPEDLESLGGSSYIHDAEQLKWAAIRVEDARTVEMVEMSILQ